MRKSYVAIALALAVALAAPVVAGECTHDTQACLNYMANNLQNKGWAGVELDYGETVTVNTVHEGTPAERAGVRVGDVLVAVNGIEINEENHEKLGALMQEMKPGKTFDYTIARKGKEREISITLEKMPDDVMMAMIGKHMLDHATVEVASK